MSRLFRLFNRQVAPFALLLAVALIWSLASAQDSGRPEKRVPHTRADVTYSYASIVKRAAPAVVNVYVHSKARRRRSPLFEDPFFERFFGRRMPGRRQQNSLGSGVIVSPEGIVVTNNHVVRTKGRAEIKVALADGREFPATIMLKDEQTDLAVLRIKNADRDFPYLPLGDSDALEVGDIVLAIGNPFGVGQTVTSGIVSALARTRVGISDYQFFIQTDAAINPGNSGGPLVDMNGQVAGINTAIFSKSGGSHGIGFAIPSNMVRVVVKSALRGNKVERPWLGAELQRVTSDIAEAAELDRPSGALIASVTRGSPAAGAGLRPGDVIIAVDGHEVRDPQSVLYRLATKGVGGQAQVDYISRGRKRQAAIALIAAPETVARDIRELAGRNPFSGATVANLSPAVAEELAIHETSGVVVVETKAYSMARRFGLRPGDIIVKVNRKAVRSTKQLAGLLRRRARVWDFIIRRGSVERRVVLRG